MRKHHKQGNSTRVLFSQTEGRESKLPIRKNILWHGQMFLTGLLEPAEPLQQCSPMVLAAPPAWRCGGHLHVSRAVPAVFSTDKVRGVHRAPVIHWPARSSRKAHHRAAGCGCNLQNAVLCLAFSILLGIEHSPVPLGVTWLLLTCERFAWQPGAARRSSDGFSQAVQHRADT